jgi:hypothetical protein
LAEEALASRKQSESGECYTMEDYHMTASIVVTAIICAGALVAQMISYKKSTHS